MPPEETVAIDASLLLQVNERPESRLPEASRASAFRVSFLPTAKLTEEGVTTTVATATDVTVMEAVPRIPSTVAVMVAPPGETARTRPTLDTVAMLLAL